jgi:hypothetical protein
MIRSVISKLPKIPKLTSAFGALSLQAKIKIFISFFQIISTLPAIYGVKFDERLKKWLTFIDIFRRLYIFEIIDLPKNCIGSMRTQLIVHATWPFAFLLITLAVIHCASLLKRRKRQVTHGNTSVKKSIHKAPSSGGNSQPSWAISVYVTVVFLYFVLPMVCQGVFDAIKCKAFDTDDINHETNSYLIADLNIKCNVEEDDIYGGVMQMFWILFVIWSVITPLLFLCLLLSVRESVRSRRISPLAESCRFLWRDYDESMMFWDVIDTFRKLFLTGFIMFVDQKEGSSKLFRLVVANIVTGLYVSFLAIARPYKNREDLHLAVISNLLLLCMFSSGIVIQLCNYNDETCTLFIGMGWDSYSSTIFAIATAVVMLVVSFGLVGFVLFNTMTVPTLKLVNTGGKPNLDLPRYCTFHLFVSHVWSSGQAKTHAVVRKIQWLLPEIKIWLDTDELKNIGNLEESVAESAIFVLSYSKGYFRSTNCRRELHTAMQEHKPVLVIYEGNEDDLQAMKEECIESFDKDTCSGLPESKKVLRYIFQFYDPVCWMLEGAFSAVSIQQLSRGILSYLPYYQRFPGDLMGGIYVPGQLGSVRINAPVRILVCESNVGCRQVVEEVIMAMKNVPNMPFIESADDFFEKHSSAKESTDNAVFLLYLNRDVFQISDNGLLERMVKCALSQDMDIVLAHEQDSSKGGCPFSLFFQLTPQDLIEPPYQIYNRALGVPLYGLHAFREVGLKLLLCKMGAQTQEEKKSKLFSTKKSPSAGSKELLESEETSTSSVSTTR